VAKEREARRRAKAAARRAAPARRVLAANGKTLKGSGRTRRQRTHLVAFVDQETGRVDARISVDGKTNKTPALHAHVTTIGLDEAVLTADAAHTCCATAQAIIDAGKYYLPIVKRNQPTLFGQIAEILLTGEVHTWSERGHGRITRRALRSAPADRVEFPGAKQVMMTMRHRKTWNTPASRCRHLLRPWPRSHRGHRARQREQRKAAPLRTRTCATIRPACRSNSTSSTTASTKPSSPPHALANRTPLSDTPVSRTRHPET